MKKRKLFSILILGILVVMNLTLNAQNKTLIDCLESLDYSSVQLTPNLQGHFEMEVTLDGKHKIVLIVDTGSSMSILSKKLLDSLGYESFPVPDPEGREFWRVRIDNLTFGEANTGRREMLAGNLEDLFPGFVNYGQRVHGLIGSDLLARYSALIDIEWSRLYIQTR